jgi:hypothetical protein
MNCKPSLDSYKRELEPMKQLTKTGRLLPWNIPWRFIHGLRRIINLKPLK